MSSHMPPVPPANRSEKGPKRTPEVSKDKKLLEARTSCQLRGRRRYRQYQTEHHERGLLPRPAGILVVHRFLEGTAEEYMTRAVTTVARQTTMRELGALFEKSRFQFFPRGGRQKDVGDRYKIRFSSGLCLHHRSDVAPLR